MYAEAFRQRPKPVRTPGIEAGFVAVLLNKHANNGALLRFGAEDVVGVPGAFEDVCAVVDTQHADAVGPEGYGHTPLSVPVDLMGIASDHPRELPGNLW